MVVRGSVGYDELRHIRAILGGVPESMRADLLKGTRAALAPLKREIPASAATHTPARYGPILARSTKVTTRVTSGEDITATVRVTAKGHIKERDVRSINAGRLRHPLYGNRSHWYLTKVRRGFVDEPVDVARRRVIHNAEKARDAAADKILRE